MACFCPLFSGSGGNCYYVGDGGGSGILIDAGVSARNIKAALRQINIDPASIEAVFITHEHSDHVYGLKTLAKHLGCAVYSSAGTLRNLEQNGHLSAGAKAKILDPEGREAAGMFVKPFATSHDACDSIGFVIETNDQKRMAIATDLGCVTGEVRSALLGGKLVVLESNHDIAMLKGGRYPGYLKNRILSEKGHLSNDGCAAELPLLIEAGAEWIFLAHLSRENNLPELACQTAMQALSTAGMRRNRDYKLSVAPAGLPSALTIF